MKSVFIGVPCSIALRGTSAVAVALCLAALAAAPDAHATTSKAWFTDAKLEGGARVREPAPAPQPADGTVGTGVLPRQAVPMDCPALKQKEGYIGFWIRPEWNGNDGQPHRLLRAGDHGNGLLVEKSAKNMLRFVMASPAKSTAARADVSHWQAGEWHHVVVTWFHRDDRPLGIALWIDQVAVDGPIAGGNTFLDPAAMDDKRLWIGDETAQAAIDELVVRDDFNTKFSSEQLHLVYRDYFRTAPFTRIAINPDACFVLSDRRVVAGHTKQFGLMAGTDTMMIPVTNFDVRYGQWTGFDAKPFITWKTSDSKIATVDDDGMVTGRTVGRCTLTAEFRGMSAAYELYVIPVEQPDLDLISVSRLPRYETEASKNMPRSGDRIQFVARVGNFGFRPVPAGAVVRFELIPDTNRNFQLDRTEQPVRREDQVIRTVLAPGQEETVTFAWRWIDAPFWVRVSVDPGNRLSEICEANNVRCELSNARPLHFGYNPKTLEACHRERTINHVGSFSYYDWLNAQKARLDLLVRQSAGPTTTPIGITDAYRTDKITALKIGAERPGKPYEKEAEYFDGGFPVNEPVNLMAVDSAILHEFGHTCLALPDLYGYPVRPSSVLLRDDQGRLYSGGPLLPVVGTDILPMPSAVNVPCSVGYDSLMNGCHQWLHPAHSGQVQHFVGDRGPRFWGVQGKLIPERGNRLFVVDGNDDPLAGAAVYVYHVAQTGARSSATKFFADRPKFIGNTDAQGFYVFPNMTDQDWDSPETDKVDGAIEVANPFATATKDTAFTPNVWSVEGLLLLKIVSGTFTELQWLPMTEFNVEYFKGNTQFGTYTVGTSLPPSRGLTPVVRRPIPQAIRRRNRAPEAVVNTTEIVVKAGETFRIDGSKSRDPEGLPLIYRWEVRDHGFEPGESDAPVFEARAPNDAKESKCVFYVIDGLRPSEPVWIKLRVVKR